MQIETCSFVKASELLEGLTEVSESISNSGNVTWGDANRTLYTADTLYDAANERLSVDSEEMMRFLEKINSLPKKFQTYVDMEN